MRRSPSSRRWMLFCSSSGWRRRSIRRHAARCWRSRRPPLANWRSGARNLPHQFLRRPRREEPSAPPSNQRFREPLMPSSKFTFSLDPLLRIRRLVEHEHQRAVARLERERLGLEDALRRQQAMIDADKQVLRNSLVGAIDVTRLRMHASASISLMRSAQRLALELAGLHRRLEKARADLIEASRRRRSIEALRERRHEQWKYQLERLESAALDELAAAATGVWPARHKELLA